ncbi:DUF2281 domain-containing protein [Gloeocapsopsis crepidinum LEGE 06123]|uniref:DUF2281 domain-containing protein n=1 Tax=Gloeocapsopsis crepidinum LEGE 06123 TaxID=588587 RepID=A0ABR9UM03_9CHRO|nr:DUF2281 domain-containing protein [Gloeocapsopsis crepidinum]MBE9189311.1 DUF2281 domain-containing protein [Gloeocapsopsis crepidinum LEGE 06123]
MTIKEQLLQEIEFTTDTLLAATLDLLRFIKIKQSSIQPTPEVVNSANYMPVNSTGRSLLDHLKTIGTWEGDDFEECLEMVYATRGKAKFDYKAISPLLKVGLISCH